MNLPQFKLKLINELKEVTEFLRKIQDYCDKYNINYKDNEIYTSALYKKEITKELLEILMEIKIEQN